MIACDSVSLAERNKDILANVTLEVKDGEFLALTGPASSGKTSLLGIFSGRIEPLSGTRKGIDAAQCRYDRFIEPENRDERVLPFLFSSRTLGRGLMKPREEEDSIIVSRIMDLMGLAGMEETPLRELSGSLIRRILLAHALISPALLLCLDNPTDNLDLAGHTGFSRAVNWSLMKGNRSIVIATHDLNFALQRCDRIGIMHEGKLVELLKPDEVTAAVISRYFNQKVLVSKNIYNGRPEIHIFPET
jgi:ABC-type multidrug transport system ATPase subunit